MSMAHQDEAVFLRREPVQGLLGVLHLVCVAEGGELVGSVFPATPSRFPPRERSDPSGMVSETGRHLPPDALPIEMANRLDETPVRPQEYWRTVTILWTATDERSGPSTPTSGPKATSCETRLSRRYCTQNLIAAAKSVGRATLVR